MYRKMWFNMYSSQLVVLASIGSHAQSSQKVLSLHAGASTCLAVGRLEHPTCGRPVCRTAVPTPSGFQYKRGSRTPPLNNITYFTRRFLKTGNGRIGGRGHCFSFMAVPGAFPLAGIGKNSRSAPRSARPTHRNARNIRMKRAHEGNAVSVPRANAFTLSRMPLPFDRSYSWTRG